MSDVPISLPVGPTIVRVFCGYRLNTTTREDFFRELGTTFMPGTPYMQAPLGLNAYTPAVLDLPHEDGIPEEVALIVYASMKQYLEARANSLRRRIYTHSHAAVFNMRAPGGGGQFPGPDSAPTTRDDRLCCYLFENKIDWQDGETRLLFITPRTPSEEFRADFIHRAVGAREALTKTGIDQAIALATPKFGAIWLHATDAVPVPENTYDLLEDGAELTRDLVATTIPMPNLQEGVEISGASMFCFRFERNIALHLTRD